MAATAATLAVLPANAWRVLLASFVLMLLLLMLALSGGGRVGGVVRVGPRAGVNADADALGDVDDADELAADDEPLLLLPIDPPPAACRWPYDDPRRRLPMLEFEGRIANFVCRHNLRDACDWTPPYDNPFRPRDARAILRRPLEELADDLPPLPVFYAKVEHISRIRFPKRPYILMSGLSDKSMPSAVPSVMNDPNMVMLYGENVSERGPRVRPFALGLNCFQHGNLVARFLDAHGAPPGAAHMPPRFDESRIGAGEPIAVYNCGDTHHERKLVRMKLCGARSPAAKRLACEPKRQRDESGSVVDWYAAFYDELTSHYKFWLAPRGNGLATHRTWEAMMLGMVPVMTHSLLDRALFGEDGADADDLPILLVDRWEDVTDELLEREASGRFRNENMRKRFPRRRLTREFWVDEVQQFRREWLLEHGYADKQTEPLNRCWGPT